MPTLSAIGVTLATNMLADLTSDQFLHPGYKLDYGLLNPFLGRDMYEPFWGTRLQHLIGIPASLTLTEHVSSAIFSHVLQRWGILSAAENIFKIKKTPIPYLLHNAVSVFLGIFIYCTLDAAFNPLYKREGERMETWKKSLLPTFDSAPWAMTEPVLGYGLKKAFTPWAMPTAPLNLSFRKKTGLWFVDLLLPDIALYTVIKGRSWHEYAEEGLTDSERRLNGIHFAPGDKPRKI